MSKHAIHETIQNILNFEKDNKLLSPENGLTDDNINVLSYIFALIRDIDNRLTTIPEPYLRQDNLNQLNTPLAACHTNLSNFITNKQVTHINNAKTHCDTAIKAASWVLPISSTDKSSKQIEKEIGVIRKTAEQALLDIKTKNDALQKQISTMENALAAQKTEIDEFRQTNEQKTSELNQTFETKTAEANATSSEIKNQYSKLEQIFRESYQKLETSINDQNKNNITSHNNLANNSLKSIKAHEKQARDILQIVGNIGLTGNYGNRSINEEKQANFWRLITSILFGLGVFIAMVSLLSNFSGHFDFEELVIRIAISVTIVLPAIYTSKESARHRSNADKAKQTELELASLGPFLEQLPASQKAELRSKLASKYFGNETKDHEIDSPIDLNKIIELVEAVKSESQPK